MMRIKCKRTTLSEELKALEPTRAAGQWAWPVELDREYCVFSLGQVGNGLWYATFEHHEREMPVSAPLALFDVVDPAPSLAWRIRVNVNEVSFQPVEFDDPFFCDDVQERRGDALSRYRAMKARLGAD